jgi:REP element-mobilizing transposase RayT
MAYWRHYYHLVWATYQRRPFITPEIETKLHGYLIGKAATFHCVIHAIGGIENHLHLVASIAPKISVADFVGQLKGSSSHHVNHHLPDLQHGFGWQRGYGSFTLGKKQLNDAVQYVLHQKEHHRNGTIVTALERDDEEDDGVVTAFSCEQSPVSMVKDAETPYNVGVSLLDL